MKPESRAALLKAQAALEDAYRVCLEEALSADTHEKRVKIASAITHLPRYASDLAEMVDPKPKASLDVFRDYGNLAGQQYQPNLHTQHGGVIKNTAAW
jgi:hypothetical protein